MRLHFSRDHSDVTPEKTVAFKEDTEVTTTQEIGRRALKARAAREIKPEQAPKTKAEQDSSGD